MSENNGRGWRPTPAQLAQLSTDDQADLQCVEWMMDVTAFQNAPGTEYFRERAVRELLEVRDALEVVDPTDTATIIRLQVQAGAVRRFLDWSNEARSVGEAAERRLQAADNEDENYVD